MPVPPADPNDRTPSFGANRHRMEIELMEKRFRERSDRGGGGSMATGEIDVKVTDEARQFFETSTQALQNVVPQLEQGEEGRSMIETTGEIRKKIDEFFTEMKESAGVAAAPAPAPAPAAAAPAPTRTAARAEPPAAGVKPRLSASPAAPAPAAPEAGQMDLKTALEKLRRHGVAKGSDLAARPSPQRSAPISEPAPAPAPAPSPAPAASQAPAPAPFRAAPAAREASAGPITPQRVFTTRPGMTPPAAPAPARSQVPTPVPSPASAVPAKPALGRELPPLPTGPNVPILPRPTTERIRELSQLPPIASPDDPAPPAPPPTIRGARPVGAPPPRTSEPERAAARPPERTLPPRPSELRRPAPDARQTPPAPQAPDPSENFDQIFDEVHGLVMDTLKVSVNESLTAAREHETELAKVAVPTAEPAPPSQPISQSISDSISQHLSRPIEDDEEEPDVAPTGPYDWGVKSAARPKGAWLLDANVEPTGAAPAPAAAEKTPSGPVAGGARGYLLKKAGDEVRKFQPVVKALQRSKLVDDAVLGAKPAADGDDEFVSADSFHDDRPKPEEIEAELSPMRLVEELRKIKRVTQALIDRGVITAEDLNKAAAD